MLEPFGDQAFGCCGLLLRCHPRGWAGEGARKSAIRNSAPDPGHRSRSPRGAACRKGGARQRAISSASTAEAKPPGKDLEGVELRNYLARLFYKTSLVHQMLQSSSGEHVLRARRALRLRTRQLPLQVRRSRCRESCFRSLSKIRTCRISTTRKFPCRMTKVMK